jgi:glycerol kinase
MEPILAIDQGTSGTKAIVVDDSGNVLAQAEYGVKPTYLPDGGVEVDPQELLQSVLATGRAAITEAGTAVAGVALANQGETVLAWDPQSGRPLSPAIVWQDRRAESVCKPLAAHGPRLAQKTGLVLDPYFSAPKMKWLRENVTAAGVVTTTDSWLVHQLCGEFVTDSATASRSLLVDIESAQWDPELIDIFELGNEQLPRIVDCDQRVGTTTSFGAEIIVGGLIVDQAASLLAEKCCTAGQAKCTFGTGAFLLANTGDIVVRSQSGLSASVAWTTRNEKAYYVDGQVYTAASAVRWLIDLGLITGAHELDTVAVEETAGVLAVPALAGLAAPWWRPRATASFSGMTLASGRGELVMAVLQGIAAQVAEVLDVIASEGSSPLKSLRVDGGLTRSAVLMQAVADIAQLPVELYPSPDATALGAAALGRMCHQPGLAPLDATGDWTAETTYQPRWSRDRTHDFRSRWAAALAANLPQAQA